jgi:hypothetical protein
VKVYHFLLIFFSVSFAGIFFTDRLYISQLKKRFLDLERDRIITSNKLATANIVHENLNHVKDLITYNMEFKEKKDDKNHDTYFFEFITDCVNDLKLKLVSVKPSRPVTDGRIKTHTYSIEIVGDFFRFSELCGKFENSKRISSIKSFSVKLLNKADRKYYIPGTENVFISMEVDTYRILQ